jgi:glycine dehydrogenase subunit 1
MKYISLSRQDIKEMMKVIGISHPEELFTPIPEKIRHPGPLKVPGPLSEPELIQLFQDIAHHQNNFASFNSFLGGGAYPHFIPAAVDYLSTRGEFVSPYTPYQPEVSQGTLQVIFEFQTLICQLTGMDIANASLYDGASGAAEAVLMANRITRRPKVILAASLHPQYRQTIKTYCQNIGLIIEEISYNEEGRIDLTSLEQMVDDQTAAVVVQSPNYFGVVEEWGPVFKLGRQKGALGIAVIAEALSLALLQPPGAEGADVVTGEAQSFGLPLAYGGPYLGFMACRQEFIRQFPGRIAGETRDVNGQRGYVLTLSTREQHIRRERATSNICTNQAWCALRATIYLELLGRRGLRELAQQNFYKANYLQEELVRIPGVSLRFQGPVFNEFVIQLPVAPARLEPYFRENKIIPGLTLEEDYPELKNCLLLCATEVHPKETLDRLVNVLTEAIARVKEKGGQE